MKNKICPYKRVCRDECYGDNPCCFAKAFDGLNKKLQNLKRENERLKERIAKLEEI